MTSKRSIFFSSGVAVLVIFAGVVIWNNTRSSTFSPAPGQVVDHPSCLAPNVVTAAMPGASTTAIGEPDAPPAGAVPADFGAVGLVVCEFVGDKPENGTQVMRQTKRSGDGLGAALDVIATPSDSPRSTGDCITIGSAPFPVVWVIDSHNQAVRLALPTDECGQLKNNPIAAIDLVPAMDFNEFELPASA